MPGIFWRILIACIAVTFTFWLLPPVVRLIGFGPIEGDLFTVIRGCVAGLALLYILFGKTPPRPVN